MSGRVTGAIQHKLCSDMRTALSVLLQTLQVVSLESVKPVAHLAQRKRHAWKLLARLVHCEYLPRGRASPIWPYALPTVEEMTPSNARVVARPKAKAVALHFGKLNVSSCVFQSKSKLCLCQPLIIMARDCDSSPMYLPRRMDLLLGLSAE